MLTMQIVLFIVLIIKQGPSMGNLVCYDHPNWKNVSGNNYPKIGIPETTFTIKEYEVFQVTEL